MSSWPRERDLDVTHRYNSFNEWLKKRFGGRVQKVCIDAGFTCPNRDGTRSAGGCLFCDARGSGARHIATESDVRGQVQQQIEQVRRRYRAERFIAYFQAFTGTYAPIDQLRAVYDAALCDGRIVAMSVGTRSDCVNDEVVALLGEYAQKRLVFLELGLQTANQSTLDRMNRAEKVEDFVRACELAHQHGLLVVAHIMIGLPGDTADDTQRTIRLINRCGVHGVKIHNLYIDSEAPIADAWQRGEVILPSMAEYVKTVCDALEILDPAVQIHRLTGEASGEHLLAPGWVRNKAQVLAAIDTELTRRGTRQGSAYAAQQP